MSTSDSRTTTTSSRLSQFGLYRTIDARTEEFLRLSRKRQIRQGCACAAVSTAITVTVVVVILLIYEYAIAVEYSLVQRIGTNNITNNSPVAYRLDTSYFGFDQDYLERMPLLVNALQENSYVDPLLEPTLSQNRAKYLAPKLPKPKSTRKSSTGTFGYKTNGIRRTSPRPFYNEYRTPTPAPFSKAFGSRSWVDSYRNAQRLKNLQQVMNYLQKTINAKFGDIITMPTSTHIAFSGIYMEPENKDKNPDSDTKSTSSTIDLLPQSSNGFEISTSNHRPDPFYKYKPNHPGDINLLADGFFRFSPVSGVQNIPMFRPISTEKKKCIGIKCYDSTGSSSNSVEMINLQASGEIKSTEATSSSDKKPFSVFLNLFPLKPLAKDTHISETQTVIPKFTKMYVTTTRPLFQFRRKSTVPIRRTTTTRFKRPRVFIRKPVRTVSFFDVLANRRNIEEIPHKIEPKIIMHVNLYPSGESKGVERSTTESNVKTTEVNIRTYVTEMPILTSTQVEDYHIGSSGIIPVGAITPFPPPPIIVTPEATNVIPVMPYLDTTTAGWESHSWTTNPPEIIKFSHEDARTPTQSPFNTLIPQEEFYTTQPSIKRKDSVSSTEHDLQNDIEKQQTDEPRTLVVKLKNEADDITRESSTEMKISRRSEVSSIMTYVPQVTTVRAYVPEVTPERNYVTQATSERNYVTQVTSERNYVTQVTPERNYIPQVTTGRTYVPQINGHYRSVNQNSRNINDWLNAESESDRKKKLEQSVTSFRKPAYVPQYVEIRRNSTRNLSDEDSYNTKKNTENSNDNDYDQNDQKSSEESDDEEYSD